MCEDEKLKIFPVTNMRPKHTGFQGSLEFNPYVNIPPSIWYNIGIELEEIELGDNAPDPELWGTKVDATLDLGGIVIPQRRWFDISGTIGPIKDVGESSVYISDAHNPIDIRSVTFKRLEGVCFAIDLDFLIDFDFEGAGFENAECSLSIEADYKGISFFVPDWSDPKSVKFPAEWRIPSEYNESTIIELFERFVDTSCYRMEIDDECYRLIPQLTE